MALVVIVKLIPVDAGKIKSAYEMYSDGINKVKRMHLTVNVCRRIQMMGRGSRRGPLF